MAALALAVTVSGGCAVNWNPPTQGQPQPTQESPLQRALGEQPARAVPAPAAAQELFGVVWQPDLAAATQEAQNAEPGKPVVLLRVLGCLDAKL
jgi:hypothetical protein